MHVTIEKNFGRDSEGTSEKVPQEFQNQFQEELLEDATEERLGEFKN